MVGEPVSSPEADGAGEAIMTLAGPVTTSCNECNPIPMRAWRPKLGFMVPTDQSPLIQGGVYWMMDIIVYRERLNPAGGRLSKSRAMV